MAAACTGLRELGVLDALPHLRDLVALAFTELLLDRFELLSQVVLTLGVGHFLLRLRLDPPFELEQRDFTCQRVDDGLELLREIDVPRAGPAFRRFDVEERCQHVQKSQWVVDVHHHAAQLLRQAGRQRQRLFNELLDAADVRLDLDRALERFREWRNPGTHRGSGSRHDIGARPGDPLDDDVDATASLCHLANDAHRPDAVHVVRLRIVVVVLLEHQEYQPVGGERAIDGLDRDRPIDCKRLQRERKRHRAAKRQDGKLRRQCRWGGVSHAALASLAGSRR